MPRGEGKWERAATEKLIELYKAHSCLYAVASPEYPIKDKRVKALRSIVQDISLIRPNTTIKDLKKKINILRTQYLQERKKYLSHMRNGIVDEYSPTLWCYDQLRFLEPYSRIKELSPNAAPYNQVAIVEVAVSPSNCYMSDDESSPPNLSGDAAESEDVDPLTDSPPASLHESECLSPASHMSPSLPCHSNSVPATADSTSRTTTHYSSSGRAVILCPSSSSESTNPVLIPSLSSLITSAPSDTKPPSTLTSRLTSVLKSAQSVSSQTVSNLPSSVSITPSISQHPHPIHNNRDTSHSQSSVPSSPLVSLNSMMTPLSHHGTSTPSSSSMKYMPSHIRPSSSLSSSHVNAVTYHPISSSSVNTPNDHNRKRKGDIKEVYNVAALVHEAKKALQLEKPQTQEEAFGVFVARTLQEMKNKNKKMMCIAKITDILLKENEDE